MVKSERLRKRFIESGERDQESKRAWTRVRIWVRQWRRVSGSERDFCIIFREASSQPSRDRPVVSKGNWTQLVSRSIYTAGRRLG